MSSGGKKVYVGESNRRILEGEEDVSKWDDEELFRGRRRDKNGRWSGRPGRLVPVEVHQQLARRKFDEAGEVLHESVVDAVTYWRTVVLDPDADPALRMQASELIVKYTLGKPVDRSQVELSVQRDPWQDALLTALVGTDAQAAEVIDAEVVEDDDEGIRWEA